MYGGVVCQPPNVVVRYPLALTVRTGSRPGTRHPGVRSFHSSPGSGRHPLKSCSGVAGCSVPSRPRWSAVQRRVRACPARLAASVDPLPVAAAAAASRRRPSWSGVTPVLEATWPPFGFDRFSPRQCGPAGRWRQGGKSGPRRRRRRRWNEYEDGRGRTPDDQRNISNVVVSFITHAHQHPRVRDIYG